MKNDDSLAKDNLALWLANGIQRLSALHESVTLLAGGTEEPITRLGDSVLGLNPLEYGVRHPGKPGAILWQAKTAPAAEELTNLRMKRAINSLSSALLITLASGRATFASSPADAQIQSLSPPPRSLRATDFGLRADGSTDDGPAIGRLLCQAAVSNGPVTIQFPQGRNIAVRTVADRYVFWLTGQTNLTIDCGGCTFHLGPEVRFMHLIQSHNVTVRNAKIDFTPLPSVDGEVVALHPQTREVDVRLFAPERTPALGGPTHQDGEQAFFGMLWKPGPYDLVSQHLYVAAVTPLAGTHPPGIVRVRVPPEHPFPSLEDFQASSGWKISLPVPGIAHRRGPGANIVIDRNDTVTLEDIETWSAPWFAFWVGRNTGELRFAHVNIRPPLGSMRLTSSWRDGFHVKGNRASLLFDHCVLIGMNDDAFNLSTHCSRVTAVACPTRLTVLQCYPLDYVPFQVGGVLRVMDPNGSQVLGESTIVSVTGGVDPGKHQPARPVELTLAGPIVPLVPGAIAWETSSANPNTVLRDCIIRNSCRFQTPVEIEHCDFAAFPWFYGATIEGPGPDTVSIRDSILRRGRGNQKSAATFSGWASPSSPTEPKARLPLQRVALIQNDFYGSVTIHNAQKVLLQDNTFHEGAIDLAGCREVLRQSEK